MNGGLNGRYLETLEPAVTSPSLQPDTPWWQQDGSGKGGRVGAPRQHPAVVAGSVRTPSLAGPKRDARDRAHCDPEQVGAQ